MIYNFARSRFITVLVKTGCFVVLVLHAPVWAKGQIVLDSLCVRGEQVDVVFHLEKFFDEKMTQGLERGLISEIRHHVQLWQRRGLYSSIVKESAVVIRLYFDNWTKKYAMVSRTENRLTSRVGSLIEQCSQVNDLSLAPLNELNAGGKYYLTIQSNFQPILDETYAELQNWVSGQDAERDKPVQRGRFFAFFVDLLGFGDRQCEFKSREFILTPQLKIQFIE